jgi:pimeloyl-ACP methyl ester carboxylesterase
MPPTPLVLARQGSFFVNEQGMETSFARGLEPPAPGHISLRGMYVQYQIPQAKKRRAYPVVLVHGGAHTGKTYEETPDGRMGWAEYFVRHGIATYVVDHSGRGRSGFDPSHTNRAKLDHNPELVPVFSKFTNERAWTVFRIGPTPFVPYENTQFPVWAKEQYFAQIVPNTETSYAEGGQATTQALTALLDRIGPAVLLVHSQSGAYGMGAAIMRSRLVKAVVSVEPSRCQVADVDLQEVFTRVPLLTIFGDFFGGDVHDWPGRMAECVSVVNHIRALGGTAENIHLPDIGIHGNSHMLMMDANNQHLAGIILDWLNRNAFVR